MFPNFAENKVSLTYLSHYKDRTVVWLLKLKANPKLYIEKSKNIALNISKYAQ